MSVQGSCRLQLSRIKMAPFMPCISESRRDPAGSCSSVRTSPEGVSYPRDWSTATVRARRSLPPGSGAGVLVSQALCANMDETLPPSEFRVEGGEGFGNEPL